MTQHLFGTRKTSLQKGDRIGQLFEVQAVLGRGGFGIVYLVYSVETNAVYALKTFRDEYLDNLVRRERFVREANIWVDLGSHPYLVRAHLVVEIAGRLYIGMEYIAPDEHGLNSLDGYLKHRPPDLAQSLLWAVQCCYGMEYAYSKGLRNHRDIKPSNIMIGQDKTAKITDFGLAGVLDTHAGFYPRGNGAPEHTEEGGVVGTLSYMPPEQFVDSATCDERSDIYSLGIVLYQMATGGQKPFCAPRRRDNSEEERKRYRRDLHRLHSEAPVPRLDSPLFPIIQRCLEKQPAHRYSSFAELRLALASLLKQQTDQVITAPGSKALEAWEWCNRGYSLHSLGRYEEAIHCHDQALALDPDYAMAWNNKGNSLHELGLFVQALRCFDRALERDLQNAPAWNNKANSLDNLGRSDEALRCFDRALALDPRFVGGWHNKGIALFSLGRDAEALHCFERAIEINPQNAASWSNKGLVLNNLGRVREAIDCFEKALEIDPSSSATWNNAGLCWSNLGDDEEAMNCFFNAIQLDEGNDVAWNNAGFRLDGRTGYQEAVISNALMINKLSPSRT